MKTLTSPKENVAQKELVFIQKITTEIKEIIIDDVNLGVEKEETTKKIAKLIAELDKAIKQPILLKEAKQAIAISVQRWYYEYSYNSKVIRTATVSNINYSLSRYKGSGFAIRNKGLTVSPQTLYNELMGVTTNNQFQAVYEKFRPYIDDATKGLPVIDDYQKLMKGQIKVLAANPPVSNRLDKNGKPYKVNLRNRAEMFVRYQANKEDLQQFVADGTDLVWISSHADASPRCSPFQGKLYSISGESGVIDGINYTPLAEALLGTKGDGNGCISGYNCRHRLIEYQNGSKPPSDYTETEMRRLYEVDQKQRFMENQIRLLKTEERLFRKNGDIKTAKRLRARWQLLTNQYEQYSLANDRAFYRWRCSIGDEEAKIKYIYSHKNEISDIIDAKEEFTKTYNNPTISKVTVQKQDNQDYNYKIPNFDYVEPEVAKKVFVSLNNDFPELNILQGQSIGTLKQINYFGKWETSVGAKKDKNGNYIITTKGFLSFNKNIGISSKHQSTNSEVHTIVHENAHAIDTILTIEGNGVKYEDFLKPTVLAKQQSDFSTWNDFVAYANGEIRKTNNLTIDNKFSTRVVERVSQAMGYSSVAEFSNDISPYASGNTTTEVFAECFTKWYLTETPDEKFEKTFGKIFYEEKEKINNDNRSSK